MGLVDFWLNGIYFDGGVHRRNHASYVIDDFGTEKSSYQYLGLKGSSCYIKDGQVIAQAGSLSAVDDGLLLDPFVTERCYVDDAVRVDTVSDVIRNSQQDIWRRLRGRSQLAARVSVIVCAGAAVAAICGVVSAVPMIMVICVSLVARKVFLNYVKQAEEEFNKWESPIHNIVLTRQLFNSVNSDGLGVFYDRVGNSQLHCAASDEEKDLWFISLDRLRKYVDTGLVEDGGVVKRALIVESFFSSGNPFSKEVFDSVFPGEGSVIVNPNARVGSPVYSRERLKVFIANFSICRGRYQEFRDYFKDGKRKVYQQFCMRLQEAAGDTRVIARYQLIINEVIENMESHRIKAQAQFFDDYVKPVCDDLSKCVQGNRDCFRLIMPWQEPDFFDCETGL